jgi:chromosome segregation ATPase
MDQLSVLHELEEADQELSTTLERLDDLAHEVQEIGARATELSRRLARLPAERAAVAAARAEAARDIEARRQEHEQVLAAGYRDEAEARREQTRAADLLHSAERRLEAATEEEARLAEEEETASREARELWERAVGVDADPPAGDSLEELAAWATETRAALFVRRGQVAAQREAAIRQANELGSALLGEPLVAQSAALVARRVEEARR